MRRVFLLCGVLLLLAAAGLTLWQISNQRQIAQRTETLLQQSAQPTVIAQPLPQKNAAAPAFATLHIPKLELKAGEESDSFELVLPAGVAFTVNPALLTGYLASAYGLKESDANILRTQLLDKRLEKFE